MNNAEWNNLRLNLNHDWLPKTYINFLTARVSYLDNHMKKRGMLRKDVFDQWQQWQMRQRDLGIFCDEAVNALSPAQFIDEYPLNGMSEDSKKWLKEVVHNIYLARTVIVERIAKLKERMLFITDMHLRLSEVLSRETEATILPKDITFQRFYEEVLCFSKMISDLPHEVQVL